MSITHSSEAELQNINLLENINFDNNIEEMNEDINNTQENDCEDGNCFHVDMATQITCLRKYLASLKEELILKNETIISLENEVKDKNQQIYNLEQQNKKHQEDNADLFQKVEDLKRKQFLVENIIHDDKLVRFYTGFQSAELLTIFMKFVVPTATKMKYFGKDNQSRVQTKLDLKNELFMFLVGVRQGLLICDIGFRFGLSTSTVSIIIRTWVNHLYFILGTISIWPSREMVNESMPLFFKEAYPTTRVILDCTEIKVQQPSSLLVQRHAILKCLIGISPGGGVSFISRLFTGFISDKEITKQSGVISLLEAGDSVMVDKGFLISDLLTPIGVNLNILPFLGPAAQFQEHEVEETQEIAQVRIHIKRAIKRIHEFHMFDRIIPLTMAGSVNEFWTVCCLLVNFQGCLSSKVDDVDEENF